MYNIAHLYSYTSLFIYQFKHKIAIEVNKNLYKLKNYFINAFLPMTTINQEKI